MIRQHKTNRDKLVSEYSEHIPPTENTVTYREAQVATQSSSSKPNKRTASKKADHRRLNATTSEPSKGKTSKHADPRQLKAKECMEFGVKIPKDKQKVCIRGVLCLSKKIVIIDDYNRALKLFDQSGTYLSSTASKDYTYGITCVRDSTFATCGLENAIHLWTVQGQTIVSEDIYHVDQGADGIHFNGKYYCLVHDNFITLLDRSGKQVKKITMREAFGKLFMFGFDIHMDNDTNNIYVPCWDEDGVLCLTIEGQALWFTPLSGTWGITEIQGKLVVADIENGSLNLINKEGEYVRKLLDKDDLNGKPLYVCYEQEGNLYISYTSRSDREKISVYTVT